MFNIGDRVRILSWEELIEKWGKPNLSGDILIKHDTVRVYFNHDMRILCDHVDTIREISKFKCTGTSLLFEHLQTKWNITTDMVELVTKTINENELMELML